MMNKKCEECRRLYRSQYKYAGRYLCWRCYIKHVHRIMVPSPQNYTTYFCKGCKRKFITLKSIAPKYCSVKCREKFCHKGRHALNYKEAQNKIYNVARRNNDGCLYGITYLPKVLIGKKFKIEVLDG